MPPEPQQKLTKHSHSAVKDERLFFIVDTYTCRALFFFIFRAFLALIQKKRCKW